MNEKKYITVSQYAKIKGISNQAVYKQLNNKLKEFVILVDNKKCLKIEVLNEVEQARLKEVEQPIEQQFNNHFQPFFEKQIEEKDKTIESLLKQIEQLQIQNGRLTDTINNFQYLLAAEQKIYIEQGQPPQDTKEEQKPTKEKKGFFARLIHKANKT